MKLKSITRKTENSQICGDETTELMGQKKIKKRNQKTH